MSELNLSLNLPAELLAPTYRPDSRLRPAAPGDTAPAAESSAPPDPFANLLASIFQGFQPLPTPPGQVATAGTGPSSMLTAGSANQGGGLPFNPLLPDAGTDSAASLDGQSLPATGRELPLPGGALSPRASGLPPPVTLPGGPSAEPAAGPERTSLPDLDAIRQLLAAASDGSPRQATRANGAQIEPGNARTLPDIGAGELSAAESLESETAPDPSRPTLPEGGRILPSTPVALPLARELAFFAMSPEGAVPRNPTGGLPTGGPGLEATQTSSPAGSGWSRPDTLIPMSTLATADRGAFAGGLADRLLGIGGTGSHSARLRLHPETLGSLDVDIRVEGQKAQVWFGTATAQARDIVEGSLPRLRELFAEQGITLTRAQVDTGTGSGTGSEREGRPPEGWALQRRPMPDSAAAEGQPGPWALPRGLPSTRLVDLWA